jgi:hypothetical protein
MMVWILLRMRAFLLYVRGRNTCLGKLLESLRISQYFLKLILLAAARRGLENSTELLSQFTIFWHKKCKAQTAPKYPKISFLLHEYQARTLVYLAHKQYRRADRNPAPKKSEKKRRTLE